MQNNGVVMNSKKGMCCEPGGEKRPHTDQICKRLGPDVMRLQVALSTIARTHRT